LCERWSRRLTRPLAAVLVLALFWVGLLASLRNKGITFDELGHVTAGYSYWRLNDYRLDPENGNLPQRLMALPLVLGGPQFQFPPLDSAAWRTADEWVLGHEWFHQMNHDLSAMLFRGRAIMGLVAVALGALVWLWSRRLFGPAGGMISLLLYVLSPIVLANGALMTSDATAAFFFLAAVWSLWAALQRVTLGRVLLAGLCVGGLCVAKMSAALLAPMALGLIAVRLLQGGPLMVAIGGPGKITSRGRQTLILAGAGLIQMLVAGAVIWGCYGFRFAAFAPGEPVRGPFQHSWEQVLTPARDGQSDGTARDWPLRVADFARRHELLPEAYLYGQASLWNDTRARYGFLNGEVNATGARAFFPYAFLVKTPLMVFGVCGLALAAAWRPGRKLSTDGSRAGEIAWPTFYDTVPLWTLLGVYAVAVLSSPLNIGHRHLFALYPPLLILAGAAGFWLGEAGRTHRAFALTLAVLLAGLAVEMAYRYPNYLAYFNAIAGGPSQGYRHLVDSSLDWGQDLPGVKAYLDRHPSSGRVYFSYFGLDDPGYYRIPAERIYSAPGQDVPPPLFILNLPQDQAQAAVANVQREHPAYSVVGAFFGTDHMAQVVMLKNPGALRWEGGTYLISATMLQPINFAAGGPLGPWNERYEAAYQELAPMVGPLLGDDEAARRARLGEHSPAEWEVLLTRFEVLRFARLTAFLRAREPDDAINYSILVYRLSDADLARALHGPPPALGMDLPRSINQVPAGGNPGR
jgi:Dolichyl-phosphate-mannose-protein mannosyltransferase